MKYSIISNFISLESFFEIITIIFFIDNYLIISIFKIIKVFRCFRILKIMNVFQELYIENVDNKFKVHFFQLIILFSTLSIISGVFVTVSNLGFGDIYPTSLFSRFLIIILIIIFVSITSK